MIEGQCPHCSELNQYARPPTTAIVYCQHCRKPFGAAALTGQGAAQPRARRQPSRAGAMRPMTPTPTPRPAVARRKAPTPSQGTPVPPPPAAGLHAQGTEPTRPPQTGGPSDGNVIMPQVRSRQADSNLPVAKLVYRSVEGVEAEFQLEDQNSIGRHPKNSIRLHDREVSKRHATIDRRGTRFHLKDLGSSNGTFVNEKRISESDLADGDELMFGSMRLKFVQRSAEEDQANQSVKDLVTILPQEPGTAGSTHIHASIQEEDHDFRPAAEIADPETLKQDYEKLRVSYELSKQGMTADFSVLLENCLNMAFSLMPADNGVILLVEPETGVLVPHTVKRREGADPNEEIVLSTSIINQVINERSSILLSDAILDPRFSGAASIISQGIRSAMVVPLLANDVVYGVMHLDSRQRIGAFGEKDLQLLKSVANQAAVSIANTRLLRKVEDDAKTRGQLARFLPPHIVDQMVQGKGAPITKGGREVHASVLFCDIRGFTSLSEAASGPQEVVDMLNDYFECLVDVVFRRHGVVDKYIGDALMAHWGTLEQDDDPTFNAVAAAIEFRDAIRNLNAEREAEGKLPIGMGVGVNTGTLVAGYMGAKKRLEYTVIGDTVNTASRLCGLADPDKVLISEQTKLEVEDRIETSYLGTRKVKGKEHGVEVYEATAILSEIARTGS